MKLKVLELFGGIGACSKALERLNIEHEVVDYVEIDKYAVKSYNAIHGTNFEPQDIRTYDKDIEVDLIMHGSPCQDFSLAGKQAGGDEGSGTRSSLLYETIRIVEKLKPKYVIWENVKNVLSKKHRHNFDNYLQEMESLGYTNYYQVLNAKDYGIPQNRERVFTISILGNENYEFPKGEECDNSIKVVGNYMPSGHDASRIVDENGLAPTVKENHGTVTAVLQRFEFPQKQELTLRLKDMLESEVDEKYYLKEVKPFIYKKYNEYGDVPKMFNPYNKSEVIDIAPTQSTQCGSTTSSATVLIKEATKQGYKEAYDGDSVNLAYPESETRRGRVGNQVSQTLTTSDNMGCIIKIDIPQKVRVRSHKVNINKLKNILINHKNYSNKEIALILDKPLTLCEHWFRNDNCFSIPDEDVWLKLKTLLRIETNEFDESIMAFEEKDGVFEKSNRCYFEEGIAPTLTSTSADEKVITKLRIRKLTPKECWRLMGFDDVDFDKAALVNSNAQLYKQAGNSIVVNVLEAILTNLLK